MGDSHAGDPERPRLGDDHYKHPLGRPSFVTNPADGLPQPAAESSMSDNLAPHLTRETFVCMEDDGLYVLRIGGEDLLAVRADETQTDQRHGVTRHTITFGQIQGLSGAVADRLTDLLSTAGPKDEGVDGVWEVEPRRPQCSNYRRILMDFEGSDRHQQVERVCTAQRTEGGEYYSLNNTRIYACEHRSPRDFVSEERLRKFDGDIMALRAKATEEWDAKAALGPRKKRKLGETDG